MKKILWFILAALAVTSVCFGVDAVPVAVTSSASTFNDVLTWLVNHQVVMGMFIIGIYDFICAINPQWKNNGAGHLIYLLGQKMSGTVEKESSVVTTTTPVAETTTTTTPTV